MVAMDVEEEQQLGSDYVTAAAAVAVGVLAAAAGAGAGVVLVRCPSLSSSQPLSNQWGRTRVVPARCPSLSSSHPP
jgi:hypothetical protein